MEDKKFSSTVKIIGEINVKSLEQFLKETDDIIDAYESYKAEIQYIKEEFVQSFPRVTLEIASYGGCTDCGVAYIEQINKMKKLGIHVDTHTSFAYSMAFILHCCGERRSASKYARFLNHQTSAHIMGTLDNMINDAKFFSDCDRQLDAILLENTDMGKERIEKIHDKNTNDWILYDEAVELGIVNMYEGSPIEEDENAEFVGKQAEMAIVGFATALGISESDAIELMATILNSAMDTVELGDLNKELEDDTEECEVHPKDTECDCGKCSCGCCDDEDDFDYEEVEEYRTPNKPITFGEYLKSTKEKEVKQKEEVREEKQDKVELVDNLSGCMLFGDYQINSVDCGKCKYRIACVNETLKIIKICEENNVCDFCEYEDCGEQEKECRRIIEEYNKELKEKEDDKCKDFGNYSCDKMCKDCKAHNDCIVVTIDNIDNKCEDSECEMYGAFGVDKHEEHCDKCNYKLKKECAEATLRVLSCCEGEGDCSGCYGFRKCRLQRERCEEFLGRE